MVAEGKQCLKEFCAASDYDYNDALVDQILIKEEQLRVKLNISSKNVFQYPNFRLVYFKLQFCWFATTMVYYGIMFSPTSSVIMNNFILGTLSTVAGPLMCILLRSRFAFRRVSLATLYMIAGLGTV